MAKIKKELTKEYQLPFGLSESTLSMILGGVVVVLVALLAFNFFRSQRNEAVRNAGKVVVTNNSDGGKSITLNDEIEISSPSATPTKAPTPTAKPTNSPTPSPTKQPTAKPTVTPTPKPTITPTPRPTVKPTAKPTEKPSAGKIESGKLAVGLPTTHTVKAGETLWGIAERYYGSGFNDQDLIAANKIQNPSQIQPGQKITIPKVLQKEKTTAEKSVQPVMTDNKITGEKYTVIHGDDLWNISVRAYGDGYRYVEIAKKNNLAHPSLIHPGNVLVIPRK